LTLFSVFLSALVAATLIPAQSEAVVLYALFEDRSPVWLILVVATIGNVMGACINWWLGCFALKYQHHRRFPFTPAQITRAQSHYARWGWLSLFASWVPVIGDPITLMAGVMKEPLWRFLLVVTCAKGARYSFIALLAAGL
jgi:membrane protein YqaA with SNARE-associated domain